MAQFHAGEWLSFRAAQPEIVGETTRAPNRKFLIRRITEALEARTVAKAAEAPPTAENGSTPADVGASTPIVVNDAAREASSPAAEQAAPVVNGPQNAAPEEAQPEAVAPLAPETAAPEIAIAPPAYATPAAPEATDAPVPNEKPKLSKLDVPALQARYLEAVGRPTGSSDAGYLRWKIRQAEKGRIPVGPRQVRQPGAGEPIDCKILPLRMDAKVVARLDEARKRQGLKTRMELFRRSLHAYLTSVGEHEVAALLISEA